MQDDTTVEIWLSKDSVGSKINLTSVTDWAGLMSFPSKDNFRKSNNFEDIYSSEDIPFTRVELPVWLHV